MAPLVNVIILYTLLCYLRQNVPHESRNDSLNTFMKELNADKEAWEAAAITVVAEEPAKKTETVAPIEAETTGFTFQRCTYPSNKTSATSPFPNLVHHPPRAQCFFSLGHWARGSVKV